jgi:hypothetical protein
MSHSLSLPIAAPLPREDDPYGPGLAIQAVLSDVCQGLEASVDQDRLLEGLQATLPDAPTATQFWQALLLSARTQIEGEPAYTFGAARALLLALYQEVLTSLELEIAYAQGCLPQGILGLRASSFREYVQHITDRRGLSALYHAPHPFPWLSETINLGKEKNFFETRVTEYQAASTLQWE